jgi:cystathionine beta-synthase
MREHGFLERPPERTVGDVLRTKEREGGVPQMVSVRPNHKVRQAIALLHEHGVSQLPVVSPHDTDALVGSIGERGLLRRAAKDPAVLDAEIADVMELPFPAVSAGAPVREAVELLAGDQQALAVIEGGRPTGLVTRSDLLESLVVPA